MGRYVTGASAVILLALLVSTERLEAGEFGVSVGIDLAQQGTYVSPYTPNTIGGQFDSARLAVGGYAMLGQVLMPQMRLVAGGDAVLENDFKIFSANGEVRYLFAQKGKSNGYAGAGIGIHFFRPDASQTGLQSDTRISLNLPLGFQRRLSDSVGWFGEMRLVIADQQANSSFRFSLGLMFGSGG